MAGKLTKQDEKNAKLDKALAGSFPASDPPASSVPSPAKERPSGPLKSDKNLIDLDDEQELRFWAQEFEVDVDRLKQAIRAAGLRVDDVRRHLQHH